MKEEQVFQRDLELIHFYIMSNSLFCYILWGFIYKIKRSADAAQLNAAHLDAANLNAAHQDAAHLDAARLDAAHQISAHLVAAHLEAAHLEAAHLDAAHLDPAHLNGGRPCRCHGRTLEDAERAIMQLT